MKIKTLILYSGREVQTRKIAFYIAEQLSLFVASDVKPLDMKIAPRSYQQVIIGASVHYGRFNRILHQFVHQHVALLNQMPTAFFL